MTTEDDFQRALDANPADWQTRLVFADWLQERCDARAEGMRALGELRFHPLIEERRARRGQAAYLLMGLSTGREGVYLPDDWQELGGGWHWYPSRREAEDAAALGFSQLPAKRRAELLAARPGAERTAGDDSD